MLYVVRMKGGITDTSPDAERVLFDLARLTPPWRKVELIGEMHRTVRELTLSGLRQRHPEESAANLRRRLADILLGEELAARAYGRRREERSEDAV